MKNTVVPRDLTAWHALEDLILGYNDLEDVLDVGSGRGVHAQIMRNHGGFKVTTNSLEKPADIVGDFFDIPEDRKYCVIWASHVLEHQPNPNLFLQKCFRLLKPNGLLAVTVPPFKHNIVGGHVSLWNPGILLYQCILAGFDCSEARVKQYEYNISLMVRKKEFVMPKLRMDKGDIETLAPYFPFIATQGFDGNFKKVNW